MPSVASPSMVVIFSEALIDSAGRTQLRVGAPLISTVQAPHCEMPHPYLVPVRPSCSRMTQSNGVPGSAWYCITLPLRLRVGIEGSLVAGAGWRACRHAILEAGNGRRLNQTRLDPASDSPRADGARTAGLHAGAGRMTGSSASARDKRARRSGNSVRGGQCRRGNAITVRGCRWRSGTAATSSPARPSAATATRPAAPPRPARRRISSRCSARRC